MGKAVFITAPGALPSSCVNPLPSRPVPALPEGSQWAVKQIADACGFGTADTLRHHFRRALKLSPVGYRKRFAC